MSTLRAAPFNLVKSDLIEIIINGANIKGYNASFSDPNTAGAVIETEPNAINSPWKAGTTNY